MPEPPVVDGALAMCSFGLAPATMIATPTPVVVEGRPQATISCCTIANVPTFGMCTSLSNPEVAAATAAKLGVLTPMPCVPVLTPWVPVSTTLVGGEPALTMGSTCVCAYGGVVEIVMPGTTRTVL